MKKLMTIAFAAAIAATMNISKCSADDNSKSRSLHKQIEKTLYFPDEVKDKMENAVVYVSFSVIDSSKIMIHEINGSNKFLSDFVAKKLSALNLSNVSTEEGKVYVYKMSFHKEN